MKLHSQSLSNLLCIQVKCTGGRDIFTFSPVAVSGELTASNIVAQNPFLLSPRQLQKSRTAQLSKRVDLSPYRNPPAYWKYGNCALGTTLFSSYLHTFSIYFHLW